MRASRQTGKRTAVRQPAAGSAVIIGPTKKSAAAISARFAPLPISQRRTERDRNERDLGRRISIGERAANGAARSDRGVADERHDLGQQRHLRAHDRIVLDHALPRGGADRDGVARRRG